MAGRFELMIIMTGFLTLAFILACISSGTNNWITVEQTGSDPTVISIAIKQGLFEKCVEKKMRSRMKSNNCYSLYGYSGYDMKTWEKATAGLMVTSTILMGLAVILSGYLMLQTEARSGILSDLSPVIIGNIAAILAVIALAVYNSKYEVVRTSLAQQATGSSKNNFADTDVDFGFSFYVGWLAIFLQFFTIFFYFIFKAWNKYKAEEKRKRGPFKMTQLKPV